MGWEGLGALQLRVTQEDSYLCSLQPVVTSQMGTINNLIHVKKSDFEVFDALKVDSLESSETSGRGEFFLALQLCMRYSPPPALRFTARGGVNGPPEQRRRPGEIRVWQPVLPVSSAARSHGLVSTRGCAAVTCSVLAPSQGRVGARLRLPFQTGERRDHHPFLSARL